MPELPVKEVRMTELQLPEIKRDEIIRSLSEGQLPAADRPKFERPRLDLPGLGRRIDWRAIDPSTIDIGKTIAAVAALTRLGRPLIRWSRLTIAAGALLVVGLAAAALISNPAVRQRATRTARGIRTRVDSRSGSADRLEVERDVPVDPDAAADRPPPVASPEVSASAPAPEEVSSPA
jgi:hypothetical protein